MSFQHATGTAPIETFPIPDWLLLGTWWGTFIKKRNKRRGREREINRWTHMREGEGERERSPSSIPQMSKLIHVGISDTDPGWLQSGRIYTKPPNLREWDIILLWGIKCQIVFVMVEITDNHCLDLWIYLVVMTSEFCHCFTILSLRVRSCSFRRLMPHCLMTFTAL